MKKSGMDRNITFVIGVILLLCLTVFLVSYNEEQNITGNSIFDIFKSKKATLAKAPVENKVNAQPKQNQGLNVNAESDRFAKETLANDYLTSIGCECGANGLSCIQNGETSCNDGIDNDKDGLVDCQDGVDCRNRVAKEDAPVQISVNAYVAGESDYWDNKIFPYTSNVDAKCTMQEKGEDSYYICADKIDNDGDGLTDCQDPDCNGLFGGLTYYEQHLVRRGDGYIVGYEDESYEPSWLGDVNCATTEDAGPGTCNDDFDNDGDGLVDCNDPNCEGKCATQEYYMCCDNRDNDRDGLGDCLDPDCSETSTMCGNQPYSYPNDEHARNIHVTSCGGFEA